MLIEFPEVNPLEIVLFTEPVCKVNELFYDIQIIFGLHPELWKLELHCNFLSRLFQPCSVNLCQTGCSDGLLIKFTKYIFKLALKVIFIDYFDLVERKRRALVLKHFQNFNVFFWRYSFHSTNILTCLEIYSPAALT